MATITKSSIVVNGAVSAATNSGGTLYTAPATGYAIVNISAYSDTAFRVTVASRTVLAGTTVASDPPTIATADTKRQCVTVYIGPGQALAWTESGASGIDVSGVEFANS